MNNSGKLVAIINEVIHILPDIKKSDLSALIQIIAALENITQRSDIPGALHTQAKRALALANNITMAEIDFDKGCQKLSQCMAKMQKSFVNSYQNTSFNGSLTDNATPLPTAPVQDSSITDSITNDHLKNNNELDPEDTTNGLIIKFATSQQSVLEEFEAYTLELEKGNPQAIDAIKRTLHTWKGEFGVLGIADYASLIHSVEEMIENGSITTDTLLKLKDLLSSKLLQFAKGSIIALSGHEKKAFTSPPPHCPQLQEVGALNPLIPSPSGASEVCHQTTTIEIRSGDQSLISDFIAESRDHLHTAETCFLELECNPENKENLNSIFRAWHTIKGVAGFLGIKEINALAHKMESRMDLVRKNNLSIEPRSIDFFLEANDCLKLLVNSVESAIKGEEYTLPNDYYLVLEKMSSDNFIGNIPLAISSDAAHKRTGELLIENGSATPVEINHALDMQIHGDKRKIGEILLSESTIPTREVAGALAAQSIARQSKNIEETIRVPVNRIDQLIDSIGEAIIAQSMVLGNTMIFNATEQALKTKITHASSILRQVQELAMSLRMVSIKSTFQKMARLSRDLSKKCGREIEFITEGEDTELDKSVVENIGDPLIHMIRNAIDHGIEPPDEREAAGKPRKAIVTLRAFHRAGNIIIEISDDGRGLDSEVILKKAIANGICKNDLNLSTQEIFQFIFLPGFSTAKTVTDVSGRGVGMDVVRKNIEKLRGSVDISSSQGKGTTFSIRLPLTLAIVDGMVVYSGGYRYILPTLSILESINANDKSISTVLGNSRVINVRNELIPLFHLASILRHSPASDNETDGIVMIVEDMLGNKIGLILDEIIGQQQVVIKRIGDGIGNIPGITGGAIMSDGTVSLIIDIGGIFKLSEEIGAHRKPTVSTLKNTAYQTI